MTFRTTRRAAVAALLAGATLPVARFARAQDATAPTDHEAHHPGTPAVTEAPMTGTPGSMMATEFDLMFIDMMTVHHAGAVAMAEVALERGEHPELAQLAEVIISAQNTETEQMAAWREQWYSGAPVVSMDDMMGGMGGMMAGMPGMDMMGMMDPALAEEAMRSALEPFDLAFINAMIPHHLSALMMAEMAVQQALHPELAALAVTMFDLQLQEIAQLRQWRTDWYGTATPPRS